MKVVLASASPRRKELLAGIIPDFTVEPTSAEEVVLDSPWRTVIHNAMAKCSAVTSDADVVISADTGVFLKKKFFGKPTDAEDAFTMLKTLNRRWHKVWTAVAVRYTQDGNEVTRASAVCSWVRLRFKDDQAIRDYISTDSPLDKAGAYGIQDDIRAWHVGSLTNIIGLPVKETRSLVLKAISEAIKNREAQC